MSKPNKKAEDLITIDEAASLLEERPARIRKWISTGQIRNRRCCCRTARVRRTDVEAVAIPNASPETDILHEILGLCRMVRSGKAKPRKTLGKIEEMVQTALSQHRSDPSNG